MAEPSSKLSPKEVQDSSNEATEELPPTPPAAPEATATAATAAATVLSPLVTGAKHKAAESSLLAPPTKGLPITRIQWLKELDLGQHLSRPLDKRIRDLDHSSLALAPPLTRPISCLGNKLAGLQLYFTEIEPDIDWFDRTSLRRMYKPFIGLGGLRVPACLLIEAVTPKDKLNIVNWWRFLTKDEQKQELNLFRNIFASPTVSNRLLPANYWDKIKEQETLGQPVGAPPANDFPKDCFETIQVTLTRNSTVSWGIDLAREGDKCAVTKAPENTRLRVHDIIQSVTPWHHYVATTFSEIVDSFKRENELMLGVVRRGNKVQVKIERDEGASWGVHLKRGDRETCRVDGAPDNSQLLEGDTIYAVQENLSEQTESSSNWFQRMVNVFATNCKLHVVVHRYKYMAGSSELARKIALGGSKQRMCRGWSKSEKYDTLFHLCYVARVTENRMSIVGGAKPFETIGIPESHSKAKGARDMHFIKEGDNYVLRSKNCSKEHLQAKKWSQGLCEACLEHASFVNHTKARSLQNTDKFVFEKQDKEIKELKVALRNALRREKRRNERHEKESSQTKRQKVAAESLASMGARNDVNADEDNDEDDETDYEQQLALTAPSRYYS